VARVIRKIKVLWEEEKSWGCNCISFFGVDLVLLGGSARAVHWWLDKPVLEILSKQHRGGMGTPLFTLFRPLSLVLLRSTRRIFAARSTVPIKGTDAGHHSRDLTLVPPPPSKSFSRCFATTGRSSHAMFPEYQEHRLGSSKHCRVLANQWSVTPR
jgi:hypothetical protein